jgi:hypothetical protein
MSLQKLFLVLIIGVVLGQSVMASADMHIVFEETDTHHEHSDSHEPNLAEEDHSGDDCGHCCHAHGCSLSLISQNHGVHFDFTNELIVQYHETPYFYYSDPAIRPPIA